jgi:hypothetical protein
MPESSGPAVFIPPRRAGMLFHAAVGSLLTAGSGTCIYLAFISNSDINFILLLFLALFLFIPLPLIIYRMYALSSATYLLERNGLRIRWGLRAEDIPLTEIEWIRPAAELGYHLPLPLAGVPGALLGKRLSTELGTVEFLASQTRALLLIATPQKVFAVSPQDERGFVREFQKIMELGSLTPMRSYSTKPAAYVRAVWGDKFARSALIIGLILTLLLLIQVSLIIPTRETISLGFDAQGLSLAPVPAAQLMILPIIGALTFSADLLLGLLLYRREERHPVAFLVWISSAITPLLLIIAVFILAAR